MEIIIDSDHPDKNTFSAYSEISKNGKLNFIINLDKGFVWLNRSFSRNPVVGAIFAQFAFYDENLKENLTTFQFIPESKAEISCAKDTYLYYDLEKGQFTFIFLKEDDLTP